MEFKEIIIKEKPLLVEYKTEKGFSEYIDYMRKEYGDILDIKPSNRLRAKKTKNYGNRFHIYWETGELHGPMKAPLKHKLEKSDIFILGYLDDI